MLKCLYLFSFTNFILFKCVVLFICRKRRAEEGKEEEKEGRAKLHVSETKG